MKHLTRTIATMVIVVAEIASVGTSTTASAQSATQTQRQIARQQRIILQQQRRIQENQRLLASQQRQLAQGRATAAAVDQPSQSNGWGPLLGVLGCPPGYANLKSIGCTPVVHVQ